MLLIWMAVLMLPWGAYARGLALPVTDFAGFVAEADGAQAAQPAAQRPAAAVGPGRKCRLPGVPGSSCGPDLAQQPEQAQTPRRPGGTYRAGTEPPRRSGMMPTPPRDPPRRA